ncbi:MAG: thiamine-phosphate kinase [Corynebacterium sp.]|nr:thiamine-phosphate kinase [Corynebacterium sp.]
MTHQPSAPSTPPVTIAEAGEDATIACIRQHAPSTRNGDDAAVIEKHTAQIRTVVSTDMMLADVHFRNTWATPYELGQKAISRNFADIEAMGAHPEAALLALALPGDTPMEWVAEFSKGMANRLGDFNAELIGGDISHASSIAITVTAIGHLGGALPALTLDSARCGQQVICTGKLGYASAGLALLEHEAREQIPAEFAPLMQAQCAIIPPPGRGFVARATGVSSLTDNSDGLLRDLGRIAQRSGVHIHIDADAIAPDELLVAAGRYLDINPWEWVLAGGEDHNLIGTTSYGIATGFKRIGEVCQRNGKGSVTVASMTTDLSPAIPALPADYEGLKGWESIPVENRKLKNFSA